MIRHFALLALGLILFGSFIALGGLEPLLAREAIDWALLVTCAAATLPITAASTLRWRLIVTAMSKDPRNSFHAYYRCFISTLALSLFLPKEVVDVGGRTYWLNRTCGLAVAEASFSVVLDRLFDILLVPTLLVAILPYWLGWVPAKETFWLMVLAAAALAVALPATVSLFSAAFSRSYSAAVSIAERFTWLRKWIPGPPPDACLPASTLLCAYLITVVKYVATIGQMALLASALTLPISPDLVFLAAPLGQFAFLLAFTPGGLGIFEAGWFGALNLGGVATEPASAFVVGNRIVMVASVAALALLVRLGAAFARRRDPL